MKEPSLDVVRRSTNPFFTILVLSGAMAILVAAGSYVSQQRSDSQEVVRASVADVVAALFSKN